MTLRSCFLLAGFSFALVAGASTPQDKKALPQEEEKLWQYGMNHYNRGQWREGDRAFRDYIRRFPNGKHIEQAYHQNGYLQLWYARRYDAAREMFETLCKRFPKSTLYWPARFAIAQTYYSQGLRTRAMEEYEKIVKETDDPDRRTQAIQRIWSLKGKYFRLYVNQSFTVGQKVAVHANVRNVAEVDYRVERIKYDEVLEHIKAGETKNLARAVEKVAKGAREQVKSWKEKYSDRRLDRWRTEELEIPAKEAGIYVVSGTHERITMTVTVFVNRYGIITKAWSGKLLVFAQDRATSKPVEGMEIRVLSGKDPVRGKTDREGIFLAETFAGGTVIGVKDGELVTTDSYYHGTNRVVPMVYVYTDRPVYRPNQMVHFKAVLRQEKGETLQIEPGRKVTVEIRDAKNNEVYKREHHVSEFGSLHGQLLLGDEPALGIYRVRIRPSDQKDDYSWYWGYGRNYGEFRVDEYRKPEYEVAVNYEKRAVIQGSLVRATVQAKYYFGSPVAGAKVSYQITRARVWSYWRWWADYYDWYMEDEESRGRYRRWGERVTSGSGVTDKEGKLEIRFTPARQEFDAEYTIVANVTDLSRRAVEGAGTVKATTAEFGLAMTLSKWVYRPGDRVDAKVRARTHEGKPVANRKLRIRGYQMTYASRKWEGKEIYQGETTTDEHGIAAVDFIPDLKGGQVKLVVTAEDRFGNAVKEERWVWIYSSAWYGGASNFTGLGIIPDKKFYEKGDTAKILVTSQYKDIHVLLTLEGKGLYEHRVVKVRGQAALVEVKLDKAEYAPNVWVTVQSLKENQMVQRYHSLVVNPAEKFVQVEIKSDRNQYRPREKAVYEIRTLGADGKPVSAEVSLGVVDESIYAVQPELAEDIRKKFVRKRWSEVRTSSSLYYYDYGRAKDASKSDAEAPTGGARLRKEGLAAHRKSAKNGGERGRYAKTEIRSQFADTMYWVASVVTDERGYARVEVRIPDNLTTWRATARAHTKDHRFGQQTHKVIVRKNVIVRLELPRFFTQSDTTVVTAIAHNYLQSAKEMKIVLEVDGIDVDGKREQVIVVAPEGQKRIDWPAKIKGAGIAKVTVKALTDEESDAMKLEVPILPHGSLKWIARTGFIKGQVTEKITLPAEAIAQASELIVVVSPTHAAMVLEALDYLAGYPYGCVEQTMSRFLPTVITAQTLQKLGIQKTELAEELPKMVSAGLQRLYNFQHSDGGWGWWKNDRSNPYTTAYVLFGLAMARQADFSVTSEVMGNAVKAARRMLEDKGVEASTKMYLLYALAEAGEKVDPRADGKLNDYALALRALIYAKQGRREEAKRALGALTEHVKESGSVAFWEGTGRYGWLGHSIEITAQAMRALVAVDPESPLVPKVINWLVTVRQGNYWASTKQTAMVVFAMTDWMKKTGELEMDMTLEMELNGDRTFREHVTKTNWQKFKGTWKFKATQFNRGENTISFKKTGNGSPVYSIYLRYFAQEEHFKASKGAIEVERQYHRVVWDGNKRLLEALKEGEKVKSGEEIEVTVRVKGDRLYEYLMLEIPMPSGFEAVREQAHYWSRWSWWYSHKEYRDEKVAVAMTRIWNRRQEIKYVMRAERPGDYHILPAVVFNMYYPQIGGNSDEFRLRVVDN